MAFIFDLIIVAIIVVSMLECTHKGFVRAVLETGGGIIAGIGTYFLALPAGKWLAETVFDPIFENSVSKKLLELLGETDKSGAFEKIKNTDITGLFKTAPEKLKAIAESFGAKGEEVTGFVESITVNSSEEVVKSIAHPISLTVATVICSVVIFITLMVIIMFSAKFITKLSYFAGLGKFNKFLGFLFGVIKSAVLVLFFSVMIHYITPYIAKPMNLNPENPYENTFIYKYAEEYNPLITILPDKIER